MKSDAVTERPQLCVQHLTVAFGAVTALSDVSFDVRPNEIHAIIGPNGAGKSTLFNTISGLHRIASGSIEFEGRSLVGSAPHKIAASGIGRSFQNTAANPGETVLESMMAARHALIASGLTATMLGLPRSRRAEATHEKRVRELADFFQVAHSLEAELGALPYGIQKRVDLARAVAMEPKLLLLDEPAAGLNDSETQDLGGVISALREDLGITVLLVEHDMPLVMSISDRVTVLDFGRLVITGTPLNVRSDPRVIEAYLGAAAAPASVPL